jgi:ketopantoate hydroxymethyltransferase
MTEAVQNWMEDVKNSNYPSEKESYGLPAEAKAKMKKQA